MQNKNQSNLDDSTPNNSFLKKGNVAFRAGKYQESIKLFELALAQNPNLRSIVQFNIALAIKNLENHSTPLKQQKKTEKIPLQPISTFDGRIESDNHYTIKGWVVNKKDPSAIFDLAIEVDGIFFCHVRNSNSRPDLQRAGKSTGKGGFSVTIPIDLFVGEMHHVSVIFPNGELLASMEWECEKKQDLNDIFLLPVEEKIAVIVPIYNAIDDVKKCVKNLAQYTANDVDIILINDASTDPAINQFLAEIENFGNFKIFHNETNLGFTKTVNRAIKLAGDRDVILLNSDARVTSRWIEGFKRALATDKKIATVTPMSDRAGAFSAPEIGNNNHLPDGISENDFAIAFRRHAVGSYPTVPTGNGFCMYIRRKCLNEIGNLDSDAFPRGYGEENDFCMRARANGWRNVIDDRTYIFHDRSKSFGSEKDTLIKAGRSIVDSRYPDYKKAISIFTNSPLINLARYKARIAILDCKKKLLPRGLFVISTLTGGTPQTNRDLMLALVDKIEGWLLHCDRNVMSLYRVHQNQQDQIVRKHVLKEPVDPLTHESAEYDRVISNWLSHYDFEFVHIRHLAWHSLSLPMLAKLAGANVVNSFHDFYTVCPTVKLLDENNIYCGGACSITAGNCTPDLWGNTSLPPLKNAWVKVWREKFNKALSYCDVFVTTHESVRENILKNLDIREEIFHVIPHGRDFDQLSQLAEPFIDGECLKIIIPGNISTPKGSEIIEKLLDLDKAEKLHFHILGKSNIKNSHPRMTFHGEYKRENFAKHVKEIRPHVGAVFSIWNETWCHTLTELWSCGIPVITTNFPTLADRVNQSGGGWIINNKSAVEIYNQITAEVCLKSAIDRKIEYVIKHQKDILSAYQTKEMSEKYFNLYLKN